MKRLLYFTIVLLALSANALAQTKSVREHFLAIPNEFINADAKKRTAWIENESAESGSLTFNIPVKELTGEEGNGSAFGSLQIFNIKDGGVLLGIATNLCADNECIGLIRFLSVSKGVYADVSDDYMVIPDNDEVISILRNAPAFKKPLKDGVQVPLAIEFFGGDKTMNFIAGCEKTCDGGVVAKTYKWNGTAFTEFEYPESPEE